MRSSRQIAVYRIGVAVLAVGYTFYQFANGNWGAAGGPLRFLTNWALVGSAICAVTLVGLSFGRVKQAPITLVAVVAVMNAMVVLQYWRLYLENPALVNGNGPIVWWREYYLHLLGPLLQWFDALILLGAFRRHLRSAIWLCVLVLAYAAWSELFVGPMNDRPAGSVTSGLPYPFLNNMELRQRLVFYAVNCVVALMLYGGFVIVSRRVRRFRPQAAP